MAEPSSAYWPSELDVGAGGGTVGGIRGLLVTIAKHPFEALRFAQLLQKVLVDRDLKRRGKTDGARNDFAHLNGPLRRAFSRQSGRLRNGKCQRLSSLQIMLVYLFSIEASAVCFVDLFPALLTCAPLASNSFRKPSACPLLSSKMAP
jgi:hypothetical protein